jgi:GntR family carbon starvation induced transcriptional regulator
MQSDSKLTQAESVRDIVRADILDGRLLPGAKLNIKALEGQIGVSLGAIREALSRLSAEGLVLAEAHRGYRVSPVSKDELLDLTRTRVEIESLCLAQAIDDGDVEWESRIVAAAHRMERLQKTPSGEDARNTLAWAQAHSEFHEALVSACSSLWLHRIRKMLYEQSERYRRLSVPLDTDHREVLDEHRHIMDAVLRRDRTAALAQLEKHCSPLRTSFCDPPCCSMPRPKKA